MVITIDITPEELALVSTMTKKAEIDDVALRLEKRISGATPSKEASQPD